MNGITHIGSLDQLVQNITGRFPIHGTLRKALFANLDPSLLALCVLDICAVSSFSIERELAVAARIEKDRGPSRSSEQLDPLYSVGVLEG